MFPPDLNIFIRFMRESMQVPVTAITDDDPQIKWIFKRALEFMPAAYQAIDVRHSYSFALLNIAGAFLIASAQDIDGSTYFDDARKTFGLSGSYRAGVISSSSDNGTAQTSTVGTAMSNLDLADLQLLQTPWGRNGLAFLQEFNMNWGLS